MQDLNPLALGKIKLRCSGGSNSAESADSLPPTLQQIGHYVLQLLQTEYQDRKVMIEGLDIVDANKRLKEQIKRYIKRVYPFDRPADTKTIAIDWWRELDADKSNAAQPLAVSYHLQSFRKLLLIFLLLPSPLPSPMPSSLPAPVPSP